MQGSASLIPAWRKRFQTPVLRGDAPVSRLIDIKKGGGLFRVLRVISGQARCIEGLV